MSASNPPLVSIVIPCYLGARYLPEAIESCLRQTHANLEIIVIDDASPDNCAEIAEEYARRDGRVRVIRRAVNGGVSRAFNTGFEAARGEFMTRLAQDDYFAQEAIEIMSGYLGRYRETALVYCDFQHVIVGKQGQEEIRPYRTAEPEEALTQGNRLGVCLMWRRAVWEAVGGFEPEFDSAEDYDFLCRVAEKFRIGKCAGVAPFYARIHPEMGSNFYAAEQEVAAARVRARHAGNHWEARRILAEGHRNAAYNYRTTSRLRLAFVHSLKSLACWPFAWKSWWLLLSLPSKRGQGYLPRQ